jgi:hypothetical protein
MKENPLDPEELHRLEIDVVPAFQRKKKIEERRRIAKSLEGPLLQFPVLGKRKARELKSSISGETGGVSSSLDPINPHKLEQGEPTVPLEKTDTKAISNN